MRRAIVWFKADLRLHDNETLVSAIEHSDEIIPVYCLDDNQFTMSEFGFLKTGSYRARFLLESLADLDQNLRNLGSGLIVVKGKPEIELAKIARTFSAQKIFAKKEVSYEEKQTEERVEKELWTAHCSLETLSTSTLYHALDLPFSIRDIPDVFTSFRKRVEKESSIRDVCNKPQSIKSPLIPALQLPDLQDLGLEEQVRDSRAAILQVGGETEGIKRLNHYFDETKAISSYKDTRNEMIGPDYSTKFSAWLAMGCLSPREIYYELKKYESRFGSNQSTYWLYFELLWRDYFRFMMKKHRNKFFQQNGIRNKETDPQNYDEAVFSKWMNGETDSDFINANMLEIKLTGFMSNRGRQNVASFLCHDLKQDWRYGAAYFEQQLIDYDVCSNWGNWAYVAGVGNDPRGNRYFNIDKQAMDYDETYAYRNLWLNKN